MRPTTPRPLSHRAPDPPASAPTGGGTTRSSRRITNADNHTRNSAGPPHDDLRQALTKITADVRISLSQVGNVELAREQVEAALKGEGNFTVLA